MLTSQQDQLSIYMVSMLLLQHTIAIHYAAILIVDQSMSIWPNTQSSTSLFSLVRHQVMFRGRLADTPTSKPARKYAGIGLGMEGYGGTVHYKHDLFLSQATTYMASRQSEMICIWHCFECEMGLSPKSFKSIFSHDFRCFVHL